MKTKFKSYRSVLLVLATLILVLILAQTATTVCDVEIVDNQLTVDESGKVNGQLSWCFKEETEPRFYPPFVTCHIRNVDCAEFVGLAVGDQFQIRFPTFQFQWLGHQSPHQIFVEQVLNLEPEQIKKTHSKGLLTQVFIDG